MLSVHLISGAVSGPPLSLALLYKGKRLPNRAIRCAIYATSVVYHVNCRLSTVSKICIQLVYKKFTIWRSFPTACMVFCPVPRRALLPCRDAALPPPGYYSGRGCQCRKRSDAGAPGAEPPAKLTYSLPLPAGKSALRARAGGYPSPSGKGGRKASYRQGW